MTLTGDLFIATKRVARDKSFRAVAPASGSEIEPHFSIATLEDVDAACAAADAAFAAYAELPRVARAAFLDTAAEEIEALGDIVVERAEAESGLPRARLVGELGRTANQLRMFARELRLGDYLRVRIDHADGARVPPKPDLRLRMVALGPVAVFGASNFPLAFSTAGVDTAAALAAGCPVVVKGHPAHPGTSELVAGAVLRAAARSGTPEGVFSLINGPDNALGAALVRDPRIKAVGFTGSRSGGVALMQLAAARPVPIPVYAEMSSINPVFLLPHALEARAETLAAGYIGSLTLGAGQYCTNPGIALAIEGPALDRFMAAASSTLGASPAATMLTANIQQAFESGVAQMAASPALRQFAEGGAATGATRGQAALFTIAAADFVADVARYGAEVFGAVSLVIRCVDFAEMLGVIPHLEGQLTATLHFDDADIDLARQLVPAIEPKVGRIIANGWPTGVEVTDAMIHGGPFPATTDGRSTSVGTMAIDRFLRPVCYQDLPAALLPAELAEADAGIPRRIDGTPTF